MRISDRLKEEVKARREDWQIQKNANKKNVLHGEGGTVTLRPKEWVTHGAAEYEETFSRLPKNAYKGNVREEKMYSLTSQAKDWFLELQTVVEERNGEKKQVQKKMFPAYVLLNMVMNDETWYVVRNTRGVTGFVGPGSKPVPLTAEEITNMGFLAQAEEVPYSIGDHVLVTKGVWQDTHGIVQEVHPAKHMAVIEIDMFGRGTPVEIDFSELEKL